MVGVRGNAEHLAAAACLCGVASIFLPDAPTAGEWLAKNLQPGDVVLVKGSRGVQLERAIEIAEVTFHVNGEPVIRQHPSPHRICLHFCHLQLAISRLQIPASWTTTFPPFRIAGNLYYVGSEDLAAYLIVTPKGDILINSNLESSPPLIKKASKSLGFKYSDTRFCSSATATTITAPEAPRSSARRKPNTK